MELTREQIITMSKCGNKGVCSLCFRNIECQLKTEDAIIANSLATALLAALDSPKVWEGAPEWATVAHIGWYKTNEQESTLYCKRYTRTLQKTRIDEIAEEAAFSMSIDPDYVHIEKHKLAREIKSAILKDREERGEK